MIRGLRRAFILLALSLVLAACVSSTDRTSTAAVAPHGSSAASASPALVVPSPALTPAVDSSPAAPRDFSFIQVSDTHFPPEFKMPKNLRRLPSSPCISTIRDLRQILLQPYGIQAPKPSFVIDTGDVADFGFPGVTWKVVARCFKELPCPVYLVPGNHDNTWNAAPERFRERFGGMSYSFDFQGCHFVALCSASLCFSSPSFGEDVVRFLKNDLSKIDLSTPVFVFFHHPLNGKAFASRYDVNRVLDLLRPYNVVLTLDGHGHRAIRHSYYRLDGVEGGSTNPRKTKNPGYNIIRVTGDRLYCAYRSCDAAGAAKGLIEKTIPAQSSYPKIVIESPTERQRVEGSTLTVESKILSPNRPITAARYSIDDEMRGDLQYGNHRASGRLDLSKLTNGAHFLRVVYIGAKGAQYTRSCSFYSEPGRDPGNATALWRTQLGGASEATPLVYRGTVYLGANDGLFYALDQKTGTVKWTFNAHSQIVTSAAVSDGTLLFGAANGTFYGLTPAGDVRWTYKTDAAIFSSPVVDAQTGAVYFGNNAARLFALAVRDGKPLWINSDARFSIDSKPCISKGRVSFRAWDGHVYVVDAKTGTTIWKRPGPRKEYRVDRFHALPHNGPAMTPGGTVYIADCAAGTGEYGPGGALLVKFPADTKAISVAPNDKSLYIRKLKNGITKTDLTGKSIWTSHSAGVRLLVAPTFADGKVYVCGARGRLAALDETTGKTLWEYQVTPRLYVAAGVAVDKGIAYSVGLDGVVTAIRPVQ